jgi:UDP-hydrolysing UDP-N-acetyl-D-glucosamine 2-epimerase
MRVAIVLTARPSYAKLQPVIRALLARQVDVQLIACASALLERYGAVVAVVRQDFPTLPITECWTTLEGSSLLTSAKETGGLLVDLSGVLDRLKPDAVVVCADRHEVLAAAQAAAYLNLPLVHLQGGEQTGSIDDKVRDSITHLADWHLVATARARHRVYGLTGDWERIMTIGCPSIDLACEAQTQPPVTVEELHGVGACVDLTDRFAIVLQHPVTSDPHGPERLDQTILSVTAAGFPVLAFWPGQDAGAEAMSKTLRSWGKRVRAVRNLPPARFLRLLTQASVLVGNSSAGIRECSYLGVAVVNIGDRQQGRERAANVVDVPHENTAILDAVVRQATMGRYPSSRLYGRGDAGLRAAEVIHGIGDRAGQGRIEGDSAQELHPLSRRYAS